jgi:alpha-glucan phosphorylases
MENALPKVAYFCMEFGLDEELKIYAGGLGILAGDILKAARDGNYPVVGVGILWRQGYTKQLIDEKGTPYDCFPQYSYNFLKDTGIIIKINIRDKEVNAKVWLCDKYGNAPLYLLDTFLPENNYMLITEQLYGWFEEERIAQELILGIGGIKALKALGINVDIYHFNDSHPVFTGIELIRLKMHEDGLSFEDAWEETKKKIVFTTHTPVAAGNEVHDHEILKYMGAYNGLSYEQMVELGGDPFSMTIAGLRLSKIANAVSKLHSETANKMWEHVSGSSEIIAVTNGVHNGTWQDNRIRAAFNKNLSLWEAHMGAKRDLIEEVYKRNGIRLSEDILTIGFARRAATYKRSDLIFRKKEIIEPLIRDGRLQIILSGKAHPNDITGKKIITNLYDMSKRYPGKVVFLQDYDMEIGKLLTRGCDVWLNNPIKPLEASGTSGMKAAMNGVLNFSILDGWWPEGCIHGVNGWQIGSGYQGYDCDEHDSMDLYDVLQNEIIPIFYGNKAKWAEMMRSSIEMSRWNFSAARMLEEYYRLMYKK